MVTDDPDEAVRNLEREGDGVLVRTFKRALGNMEGVAVELAPVGHYDRSRGKAGKTGGDLRNNVKVEYLGVNGNELSARCISPLAYARAQHENLYAHPGKYTGAAGPVYEAKYFDRAFEIIFGSGNDPAGDPGGNLSTLPAGFQEMLQDATK